MQFKLFEATGDIEVHYLKAPADGRPQTAGIENYSGTDGVEYYYGIESLPDNLAIRYQRASPVDKYTLTLAAGQQVTLQTQTPFDAAGHPVPNTLDPELRIIHPDGTTLIASDQNSLDGKNASVTFSAPVSGVYTVELLATSGVGTYSISKVFADDIGPRVTDVILGSSAWAQPFVDVVDGAGTGTGNGLGASLVGPEQLSNRPWVNVDKIYIQFDEDVSNDFVSSNIELSGTHNSNYLTGANFAYGVDGENVGTITLTSPLSNDLLSLKLSDNVRDASGNALDGEWTDGVSTISGNGARGGSFNFRIDLLPGDVDNSGGVTFVDVFAVLNASGSLTNSLPLSLLDVDGNGGINLVDVFAVYNRNGSILPNGPQAGGGGGSASTLAGEGESTGQSWNRVSLLSTFAGILPAYNPVNSTAVAGQALQHTAPPGGDASELLHISPRSSGGQPNRTGGIPDWMYAVPVVESENSQTLAFDQIFADSNFLDVETALLSKRVKAKLQSSYEISFLE